MDRKIKRRDFIKLSGVAVFGAVAAGCVPPRKDTQTNNGDEIKPPSYQSIPTAVPLPDIGEMKVVDEQVPFIPKYERLNTEPLPIDVISPKDLWTSYHTRIWCNDNCRMYLRPGIEEQLLFQDLHNRKVEKLDIVLLDVNNELTDEQITNLDQELILRYKDSKEKRDGRFSGMIMGVGNSMAIFVRRYNPEESEHMFEDYPVPEDEMISTWSTPQMTLRHEVAHYNQWEFNYNLEEVVGMDNYGDLLNAAERQEGDDSSGYWVVMEMKEGVVVAKEDFMKDIQEMI